MGRAVSNSVFCSVCELSTTLGSLSVDGWGCVPVLLVVWHVVSSTGACWQLGGARSWCRDGYLTPNGHSGQGRVQRPQLLFARNACGGGDWQAVATDWGVLTLVRVLPIAHGDRG